ncbi:MAG: LuxR C-terminal-related transcriptional regulator [Bacillota bacterium]
MSLFPKDPGPPDYGAYFCSPAELKDSYDRCRALKVPVELVGLQKILPKIALAPRLTANSTLLILTEEAILPVCCAGSQRNYIYILCDPELVALKIFAAPEVLAAIEEADVNPGTVFTEESCGTNALALAREHRRLVAIRGEQHYCKLFKDWWCVAAPVKDPEGRIVGYFDISLHAEKELGLAAAHLQTLVNSIERELYLREVERKLQQTGVRLPPSLALPPEVERELTLREQEVLQLSLARLSNKEMAELLYISVRTVKKHRQNIYQKLGVRNIAELRAKLMR